MSGQRTSAMDDLDRQSAALCMEGLGKVYAHGT